MGCIPDAIQTMYPGDPEGKFEIPEYKIGKRKGTEAGRRTVHSGKYNTQNVGTPTSMRLAPIPKTQTQQYLKHHF